MSRPSTTADTASIRGMFVPNMVPLNDRGEINEPELRRYCRWLLDKGVQGLYPNGSTGEFLRFTPEERRQTVAILIDEVAGRVPILAGAAEANLRETLKACEYYHRLGARAVAVVAPFYYKLSPSAVLEYFKRLAQETPIDLTLYNIPLFASPIDVPSITHLAAEYPRVVGIKDSSGDLALMQRMMAAVRPLRPDFSFLTGWDSCLLSMLQLGCSGGTNATSGVFPELTRRLFDLAQPEPRETLAERWSAAQAVQGQVIQAFDLLLGGLDFPAGFRAGLIARGFDMGESRQPLSPEQASTARKLTEQLQALCTAWGYKNEFARLR